MPTWEEIKKYAEGQIETLHRQLESHQPDHSTELLRGEIRAFRRILARETADQPADPKTKVQPDTTGY